MCLKEGELEKRATFEVDERASGGNERSRGRRNIRIDGGSNLGRKLVDGWKIKKNQIIQKDWGKINRSRYCPEYKDLKTD